MVSPSEMARNKGLTQKWHAADVSGHPALNVESARVSFMPELESRCIELSSTPTRTRPRRKVDKDTRKKGHSRAREGLRGKGDA